MTEPVPLPEWARGLEAEVIKPLADLAKRHHLSMCGAIALSDGTGRVICPTVIVGADGEVRRLGICAIADVSAHLQALLSKGPGTRISVTDPDGTWTGLPEED